MIDIAADTEVKTPQDKKRPHISPSQISMYSRCGEQFRRRYLAKDIVPPGVALIKGSAVHKGIETNNEQKMESWADLPKDDIVEAAVSTVKEKVKNEGLLLSKEEKEEGQAKVLNRCEQGVKTLAELYSDELAPKYQPTMVEAEVRIPIPGLAYDLLGRIDLKAIDVSDGQPKEVGPAAIIDYKTSTKKKSEDEFKSSPQFTSYALADHVINGVPTSLMRAEILIDKTVPEVQTLELTRNNDDYVALIAQIAATAKGIQAEVFTPAYGLVGAWYCSPRFCGFWKTCNYVPKYRRDEE